MDRPGPRDPDYTPYVVPYMRSFDDPVYTTSVLVCGSQMGKSEAVLDVIGHRIDQRPLPMLYIGPDQNFINNELEPRVVDLINQSPSLLKKFLRGTKHKKIIAGIQLRLGWAGSASQLAAMAAGLCIIDELDRMAADVKGEGDPLTLVEARGFSFRGRKYGVTSTPLVGTVEVEKCETSGLYFWKKMAPEDIQSPVWKLFQQGTMYHFAWPCPHCDEYFIPRFRNLKWPKDASPWEARQEAYIECPCCGMEIKDDHKKDMNDRGVYVAPGQTIDPDGTLHGEPIFTSVASFWVSGLCSPFVTFGERAESFLKAHESGVVSQVQTVINTGFGELWAPAGGDAPEWQEVARLRMPYKTGDVPDWVQRVTAGIDVQKDRLYYVVRGWGEKAKSCLLDYGVLYGATRDDEDGLSVNVWDDLSELLQKTYDGLPILTAFIDSGDGNVTQRVYEFCRENPRNAVPVKGSARMQVTLKPSQVEYTVRGKTKKFGMQLWHFNADYYKAWVHEKVRREVDAVGAWLLPEDADEDYCRQIVAEAQVKKASGQVQWVKRSRDNHYLDCEAMAAAAGDRHNVARLRARSRKKDEKGNVPKKKSWAELAAQING